MDATDLRETLGTAGLAGAGLLFVGLWIVGKRDRRAAVGAASLLAGCGLLAYGLVGSFLESMGMGYEDL